MPIDFNNEHHVKDFVRLNEQWITEHFSIEEADRNLAANPFQIVRNGGHIISLVEDGRVVGVCALIKDSPQCYQLARMAVEPSERRKGYGDILIRAALKRAHESGASRVFLHSNTVLQAAIALYRKHGFSTFSEGQSPVYARSNIVLQLMLTKDTETTLREQSAPAASGV